MPFVNRQFEQHVGVASVPEMTANITVSRASRDCYMDLSYWKMLPYLTWTSTPKTFLTQIWQEMVKEQWIPFKWLLPLTKCPDLWLFVFFVLLLFLFIIKWKTVAGVKPFPELLQPVAGPVCCRVQSDSPSFRFALTAWFCIMSTGHARIVRSVSAKQS